MSVTTASPELRPRSRSLAVPAAAVAVASVMFLLSMLVQRMEDVPRSSVTFVNDATWAIEVDLVDPDDGGRVVLGTIGDRRADAIQEIGKLSDPWVFRFSSWGESATLRLSTDQLEARHHRVRVPDQLLERLKTLHAPASPF